MDIFKVKVYKSNNELLMSELFDTETEAINYAETETCLFNYRCKIFWFDNVACKFVLKYKTALTND